MQYGVNRGGVYLYILGTVKFHVVCLRPQTSCRHTFTSMHTTGAALAVAANLHHPRPVCKNWLVKNFEFLVTRRSKKISFLGADPQTGSGSHRFDGGSVAPDENYRTVKKIAPIGPEMAEILRVKEIRLAPPSGQTGTASHRWSPEFRRGVRGLRCPEVWRRWAFKRRRTMSRNFS